MKTKRRLMIAIAVLAMFLIAGQVFAVNYSYFMTVPRLGYQSTSNVGKAGFCTPVTLEVHQVGGNFNLDAKAETGSNELVGGPNFVTDGTNVSWNDSFNCSAGSLRHVVFNNNNFVNVQVSGSWSPG